MRVLFYIYPFFTFFIESFRLFSFSNIKELNESIQSSTSLTGLALLKGEVREHCGFVLGLTISFIWLTLLSIVLSFFYTYLGLSLVTISIAGFIFFINQWRYINGLGDLCLNKKHELESA